ncbi:MAG: hypothetical protein IKC35_04455 [Clostridia bacterium]|nr:hypothetical protein [Clostridia bacterium]
MNKFFNKLKSLKNKEIIIAAITVVILLVIYFSSFFPTEKTKSEIAPADYCSAKQMQIEQAVSQMEGVGKAQVVINWSSGVEIVTAVNTTVNGNSTTTQIVHSSGEPIVIKEIYPRAVGVLIVCEGGSNAKVKVDIIMAIATLMDISTDKVLVFEMTK